MDLQWWIAVIAVPLVAAIFGLMFAFQSQANKAITEVRAHGEKLTTEHRRASDMAIIGLRDELNLHKIRVAEQYVSQTRLSEVEERIMNYLEKLDGKIDRLGEGQKNG